MNYQFKIDLFDLYRCLGLLLVRLLLFMYQWKLYKSISSSVRGRSKAASKVYFRQALGMMCLSNHKADLGPIHLHLTDSIKRMVGRRKKKKIM